MATPLSLIVGGSAAAGYERGWSFWICETIAFCLVLAGIDLYYLNGVPLGVAARPFAAGLAVSGVGFWWLKFIDVIRALWLRLTKKGSTERLLHEPLALITVHSDGFPQVVLRDGDHSPRFILLPHVTIANGQPSRHVSLSCELGIEVSDSHDVRYVALGEDLGNWEFLKQIHQVEYIYPRLPLPLNLAPNQSTSGYLTFHYVAILFTDGDVGGVTMINVNRIAQSYRPLFLFIRDLHSGAVKKCPIGTIDVRDLVMPRGVVMP